MVTIAHISDPHVGSPYFVPNLMNRVIVELNELRPDVVICSGDLASEGYRQEFKNWVGTVASLRVRGYTKPCYNVLEFEGDDVRITRRYPFGGSSVIAHFALSTGEQFQRELEPPVQQRTTVAQGQQGE